MSRLLFIILLWLPSQLLGQQDQKNERRLDVLLGGGTMYYVGDLKDDQLPQSDYLTLFPYIGLRYSTPARTSFRVGYFKSKLKGADQWGESNASRDFQFRSPIDDLHLLARIDLMKKPSESNVSAGALLGVGYFWFRPEIYNGFWTDAQSLGTEGQYLEGNYPEPYKLSGWNYKYGLELSVKIKDTWTLDLYWLHTHTFTDHLDDVSGKYPDPLDVANAENGAVLAGFSYRYLDGHVPEGDDAFRGNPKLKDGYVNLGIGLRKTIGSYSGNGNRKKCQAYD